MSDNITTTVELRDSQRDRRERIATAVLAGFCSQMEAWTDWPDSALAQQSVRTADALIAALDAEEGDGVA